MVDKEPTSTTNPEYADWLGEASKPTNDLMERVKENRQEREAAHSEIVAGEQKFQLTQERYKEIVEAIPVGSQVTIEAHKDKTIRVFDIKTERQPDFVNRGFKFIGIKQNVENLDYITKLANKDFYILLDNSRVSFDWDLVYVEELGASE